MKKDLGLTSVDELVKCDVKSLTLSLQRLINKRVQETSIKTIRYELYLARNFFSFFDVDISLRRIKIPKKGAKSRVDRIPSLDELQRLVAGARSPRMRLAVTMLALTGMRLGECLSVRREHIDLERGVITIPPENTKTGRGREVPIPSELRVELKQYLEKHFQNQRGYLFSAKGNPEKRIPTTRFYEHYRRLLSKLGLDQKTPDGSAYALHPHVFRKWYRTMLESADVNKLLIDIWLGHNSGVEKLYYLPTPEIVKKEFEKADGVLRLFGRTVDDGVKTLEQKVEAMREWMSVLEMYVKSLTGERLGPVQDGKGYTRLIFHERRGSLPPS